MPEFKLIEKLLYKSEKNDIEAEFIIGNKTLWSSQKVIAEIFGTTSANISMHFSNITQEGELDEKEVSISSKDLFKDQPDFIKKSLKKSNNRGRPQKWYNLDAIISIGYRINSKEATQFRRWANKILKEYMIKGFVIDKELLKKGGRFTEDYFDELLETIREIMASERRFNQKITDIYATSFDYDKDADITKEFFATVQNKLIYAISNHTAAELIETRSDIENVHMGLTTWKKSPNGKILQSDVVISKNYLNQNELSRLNSLVEGFLNLAESRAEDRIPMGMKDWKELLDDYLKLRRLPILVGKGKISSEEAKEHVLEKYKKFRVIQDENFISDFDQMILDIKRLEGK